MSDAGWDGIVAGLYIVSFVVFAAIVAGAIRAGIRGLTRWL